MSYAKIDSPNPSIAPSVIVRRTPQNSTLHRCEMKAFVGTFDPLYGRPPDASLPLGKIEIDQARLNLMTLTRDQKMRRPWITVAFMAPSRVVLGFYISVDLPS
jgi:hypothetical protein